MDFQVNDRYQRRCRQNIGLAGDHGVHQIVTAAERDSLQAQIFLVEESLFLRDEYGQARDDLQIGNPHFCAILMSPLAGSKQPREENRRSPDRQ
jgi:hypothetical protein